MFEYYLGVWTVCCAVEMFKQGIDVNPLCYFSNNNSGDHVPLMGNRKKAQKAVISWQNKQNLSELINREENSLGLGSHVTLKYSDFQNRILPMGWICIYIVIYSYLITWLDSQIKC